MGRPRAERKPQDQASKAGRNRGVRLTDACFDAWQFWKNQMGMSYEESLWFFMEHSPIEVKVPKGIMVKGRARTPER
jgi:hypothetical protein